MNREKLEFRIVVLEKASKELISMVLYVCETELAKHGDEIKGLPSAAMAVRESILTFLALIGQK